MHGQLIIIIGATFVTYYFTGEECDVAPFLDEYASTSGIPIASAGTAYYDEITGLTFILDVNQGLYFGKRMEHSLFNPNQIRDYGIKLNNNPFYKENYFGIQDHDPGVRIPFNVKHRMIRFETRTTQI